MAWDRKEYADMKKPRAFIHFQMTPKHDELGVLAIGRVHIPTSVVIVFTLLVGAILALVSGILVQVSGNSNGWALIIGYCIFIGVLAVIGSLASLLAWMGRSVIDANTYTTRERNDTDYY